MDILLSGISKRFGRNVVLRDIDLQITSGEHLAILGANGSGKSTLLKIISSFSSPSKGDIEYKIGNQAISKDEVFRLIYHVAPDIDVYTEMNLKELLRFHFALRDWTDGWNELRFMDYLGLPKDRALADYSSGMRQRVRIALAWATASSLLLFDEVSMNLDEEGMDWFRAGLQEFAGNRTVLFGSNQAEAETRSCQRRFRLEKGSLQVVD